ncbi:hypothetical protein HZH66_003013 [Vespula vulgaris]|uniref:Uncharacterized protein n=1 Tax=Vespula vulgaris TaxID=7454 RepID=A0A834KMG8_VESVU|nr:hypothetical protein HZH66_003013 [Vespula vulgaris]
MEYESESRSTVCCFTHVLLNLTHSLYCDTSVLTQRVLLSRGYANITKDSSSSSSFSSFSSSSSSSHSSSSIFSLMPSFFSLK